MSLDFSMLSGLQKIGGGKYGVIYKAPPSSLHPNLKKTYVVKKYKKKVLAGNEQAIDQYLRSLIEARKQAPVELQKIIDTSTIWPQSVVYENGSACGFVMDLIPELFFLRADFGLGEERVDAKFEWILDSNAHRARLGLPVINGAALAKITFDLLRVTAALHGGNFVVGDISPNNILVAIDPVNQGKSRVLVIDSDSFRIAGRVHPLKQPHTPSWVPPEALAAARQRGELERAGGDPLEISRLRALENIQNTQTDVYKICLAIMRMFHNQENRTSVPVSPVARGRMSQVFGASFADLVYQGLSAAPGARPSAEVLFAALTQSLKQ